MQRPLPAREAAHGPGSAAATQACTRVRCPRPPSCPPQRSGILIDACRLGAGHSSFLQQAAYLTGGTYLRPAQPQALVQYLNVSLGCVPEAPGAGITGSGWGIWRL